MKRKLFWVLYFTTAILLITLAALLMPEYIVLTWHSLFPVGYCLLLALFAWLSSDRMHSYRINSWNLSHIFWRIKYDPKLGLSENDEDGVGKILSDFDEETNQVDHIICRAMSYFIPLLFIFVFFFSVTVKILSGFAVLIPLFIGFGYGVFASIKAEQKRKAEIAQMRKEQEQREQWGRWK